MKSFLEDEMTNLELPNTSFQREKKGETLVSFKVSDSIKEASPERVSAHDLQAPLPAVKYHKKSTIKRRKTTKQYNPVETYELGMYAHDQALDIRRHT